MREEWSSFLHGTLLSWEEEEGWSQEGHYLPLGTGGIGLPTSTHSLPAGRTRGTHRLQGDQVKMQAES